MILALPVFVVVRQLEPMHRVVLVSSLGQVMPKSEEVL